MIFKDTLSDLKKSWTSSLTCKILIHVYQIQFTLYIIHVFQFIHVHSFAMIMYGKCKLSKPSYFYIIYSINKWIVDFSWKKKFLFNNSINLSTQIYRHYIKSSYMYTHVLTAIYFSKDPKNNVHVSASTFCN